MTATLPTTTIDVESFRDWLIAAAAETRMSGEDGGSGGSGGSGASGACGDDRLAAAMAEGVPAAWALFQDIIRPRMVASVMPFCDDARSALQISDATCAALYVGREESGKGSLRELPRDVPLLLYCRVLAWLELLDRAAKSRRHSDPAADSLAIPSLPFAGDPASLAREVSRAATRDGVTHGDPLVAKLVEFERRLTPELRAMSLAEQLERQRPGNRDRLRTVKILNLPAALTLGFCALISIAALYILEQRDDDRLERMTAGLVEAVKAARFDEAVRGLADDPPAGLENLLPVLPQTRMQRIRGLRARAVEQPHVAVLSPHGKIDEQRPAIVLRTQGLTGAMKLRIVDSATLTSVVDRDISADERRVDPGVTFPRGGMYIFGVEHARGVFARSQFEILTEEERDAIETEVARVTALVADQDPAVLAFLRAHVYRAASCFDAALAEWHKLAALFPEHAYPREEAACMLETELRLSWLALNELDRQL